MPGIQETFGGRPSLVIRAMVNKIDAFAFRKGAMLIGVLVSMIIYGITTIQASSFRIT